MPDTKSYSYHDVYLLIIQEVWWILLLQGGQCVLQLCLKVLHLSEDQSLTGATVRFNLLVLNELMKQEIRKTCSGCSLCLSLRYGFFFLICFDLKYLPVQIEAT